MKESHESPEIYIYIYIYIYVSDEVRKCSWTILENILSTSSHPFISHTCSWVFVDPKILMISHDLISKKLISKAPAVAQGWRKDRWNYGDVIEVVQFHERHRKLCKFQKEVREYKLEDGSRFWKDSPCGPWGEYFTQHGVHTVWLKHGKGHVMKMNIGVCVKSSDATKMRHHMLNVVKHKSKRPWLKQLN